MGPGERIANALRELTERDVRHEAVRVVGDASSRQYFRVRTHDTLWPSLMAMVLPQDANRSDEGGTGSSSEELPFINVQRYLAAGGLPVPQVMKHSPMHGVVLLEDLGRTHLLDVAPQQRRQPYEQAVDLIVDLQRLGAERPDESCQAFGRFFDSRLLFWELEHFVVNTLVRRHNVELTAAERDEVDRIFHLLAERLAGEVRVLVHRDFQSKNLLLQEERLRLLDFQDALMGPRAYDMVALLRDSYVELTLEERAALIRRYVEATGVDRDDFEELFDWQTVQRKLKDAGRFDFIDLVKGNDSFLRYVPLSLKYVREAALRHKPLSPLVEIFGRYVPGLKG